MMGQIEASLVNSAKPRSMNATAMLRERVEDWFDRQGLTYFTVAHTRWDYVVRTTESSASLILPLLAVFLVSGARLATAVLLSASILAKILSLVVTFFVTSSSLAARRRRHRFFPLVLWAVKESWRQLQRLVRSVVQMLPPLLLFVAFLFVQAEAWQVAADLNGPILWIALAFFPAIGIVFATVRLHLTIRGEEPTVKSAEDGMIDYKKVHSVLAESDHEVMRQLSGLVSAETCHLAEPEFRQRTNLLVVMLFALVLQAVIASLAIWAVLVTFGMLVIEPQTAADWLKHPVKVYWSQQFFDKELVLTEQLLQVAAFIASFSAMYFTAKSIDGDPSIGYYLPVCERMAREAFAAEAVYLAARWEPQKEYAKNGEYCYVTFELPATVQANEAVVKVSSSADSATGYPMRRRRDGRFILMRQKIEPVRNYTYYYLLDDSNRAVDSGWILPVNGVQYSVLCLKCPPSTDSAVIRSSMRSMARDHPAPHPTLVKPLEGPMDHH
jgi:hypothetical protein